MAFWNEIRALSSCKRKFLGWGACLLIAIKPWVKRRLLGIPFYYRWVMTLNKWLWTIPVPLSITGDHQSWRADQCLYLLPSLYPAEQASFHSLDAILPFLGALLLSCLPSSAGQSCALHRLIILVDVLASSNSGTALGTVDCKTQACGKCVLLTTFFLD